MPSGTRRGTARSPVTSARPDPKLDAIFGATSIDQINQWRELSAPPAEVVPWDRSPVVVKVEGVIHEYFEIGAIAAALGRKTVTIRSWETKKIIPKAPYRLPPRPGTLPDRTAKGRRLWGRAHIEAVVAAAHATGVYDPANAPNANWAEFTRLVRAAWAELRRGSI